MNTKLSLIRSVRANRWNIVWHETGWKVSFQAHSAFQPLLVTHEGHSTQGSIWASSLQWDETEGLNFISRRTTECHCHRQCILSLPPRAVTWKGPALKQARLCESLRVCTYGCRGSNLECAGGYGLFDMIDSPCSSERVETSATYSGVCLSKPGGWGAPSRLAAVLFYPLTINLLLIRT